MGGKAARNALPSASLGNISATTLLVLILFHIGMKHFPKPSNPKKNITLYWYLVVGFKGLPPRPAYQACHGTTVEMQGTPSVSHTRATGLSVSGRRTRDDQVDPVVEDEVAGHLRSPVGV